MSESRRAARALVDRHSERFESRHPCDEAQRRLAAALAHAGSTRHVVFVPAWHAHASGCVLDATFDPPPRATRILQGLSVSMFLLVLGTVLTWVLPDPPSPMRFGMLIFTLIVALALPIVVTGLGSQRQADEARVRKAIRVALLDEEEGYPPPRDWDDEGSDRRAR